MVLAPLLFGVFTAVPSHAAVVHPLVMHDAIVAAAHGSAPRLQTALQQRRGEPYQLSPKAAKRLACFVIGAGAGFLAGTVLAMHSGATPGGGMAVVVGRSLGGGVIGTLLAGSWH